MRFNGTIVEWNEGRGFGFIEPGPGATGGVNRVFCHIKAYKTLTAMPTVGQRVTYELSRDQQNRPRAVRVIPAGTFIPSKDAASPPSPMRAKFGAFLFLAAVVALAVLGRIAWYLPPWYVALSIATAIAYAIDKGHAERGRWRTTEMTLQTMALIGGWPGAWIAQQDLRHKSRKGSFQFTFWFAVVLNVAALSLLAVTRMHPLAPLLRH